MCRDFTSQADKTFGRKFICFAYNTFYCLVSFQCMLGGSHVEVLHEVDHSILDH